MKINRNQKLQEIAPKNTIHLNIIFAFKAFLLLSIFSFQGHAQSTESPIPDSEKNILNKADKFQNENSKIIEQIIIFQDIPTFPKFLITGDPVKDESDYAVRKNKWIEENQLTYDLLQPKSLPNAEEEKLIESKKMLIKL